MNWWKRHSEALLALVALLSLSGSLARADDAIAEAEAKEPAAAILLEPGETPPPFVQLTPEHAPEPWMVKRVGEFHLLDQDDQPVTRETMLGEQWIVNFIFARCVSHCPATSRKIMELNQELRDVPVRFVTLTVDPVHDTVPIMAEFASIWGAKPPRWRFVTGDPDEVMKLIRTGFKVPSWENVGTTRRPGMEFAHSNHLIHVDAKGEILGRYDSGMDAEMVTLRRVVKGEIPTPLKYQPATKDQIEALKQRQKEILDRHPAEQKEDPLQKLPEWARRLPLTNAMLNSLATLLLLQGYVAVKLGRIKLHKQMMLTAFFVSIVFLGSYLTYHGAMHYYADSHGKPFNGTGAIRSVYYCILISHVFLAALVPVLAIITILNGRKAYPDGILPAEAAKLVEERRIHKKWAWFTFPIWLYVSVTGVVIYWMLYQM